MKHGWTLAFFLLSLISLGLLSPIFSSNHSDPIKKKVTSKTKKEVSEMVANGDYLAVRQSLEKQPPSDQKEFLIAFCLINENPLSYLSLAVPHLQKIRFVQPYRKTFTSELLPKATPIIHQWIDQENLTLTGQWISVLKKFDRQAEIEDIYRQLRQKIHATNIRDILSLLPLSETRSVSIQKQIREELTNGNFDLINDYPLDTTSFLTAVCQHIFLLFPIDTPDLILTTEALEQLPSYQKERVLDLLVKTFWFDEGEKVLSLLPILSEPSKVVKSLFKLAQKENRHDLLEKIALSDYDFFDVTTLNHLALWTFQKGNFQHAKTLFSKIPDTSLTHPEAKILATILSEPETPIPDTLSPRSLKKLLSLSDNPHILNECLRLLPFDRNLAYAQVIVNGLENKWAEVYQSILTLPSSLRELKGIKRLEVIALIEKGDRDHAKEVFFKKPTSAHAPTPFIANYEMKILQKWPEQLIKAQFYLDDAEHISQVKHLFKQIDFQSCDPRTYTKTKIHLLYAQKQWIDLIQYLEEHQQQENFPREYAESYMHAGRYDRALEIYRTLTPEHPQDEIAHINCLIHTGEQENAKQRAKEIYPHLSLTYRKQLTELFHPSKEAVIQRTISADPESLSATLQWLQASLSPTSPDLHLAAHTAETLAVRYPQFPVIHYLLGHLKFLLHQNIQATQSLKAALALDPSYGEAYMLLAQAEANPTDSLHAAKQATHWLPNNPDAWILFASLSEKNGFLYDAIHGWKVVVRLTNNSEHKQHLTHLLKNITL